jgi:hypothetical protein
MRLMRLSADLGWPMRDSPQPLIHLEAAVLQMATLEPGETLAQLLARLEALEKRLGGGAPGSAPSRPAPGSVLSGARPVGPAESRSLAPGSPEAASRFGRRSPPLPAPAPSIQARSGPAEAGTPPGSARLGAPGAKPLPNSPEPRLSGPVPASGSRPSASAITATTTAPAALADEEPPLLDGETLQRWERVMEAVNARKRMLGAFLQESRFRGVTNDAIVIAMDDLHRSVVDERVNRELVESEAATVFGRALTLRCVAPDPGDVPRPRQEADVRPLVERAIAWFDGDPVPPGRPAPRSDA